MNSPILNHGQIAQVSGLVAQYITAQRESFLPQCMALTQPERESMHGFFSPQLLDGVRVVVLRDQRVSNPTFYAMLGQMGLRNLPDFAEMAAITFGDVVVSHEPFTNRLLFHELVHVEQYRQLGIPRFAELYVRGFLSGGGYDGIPLEVNAYTLDARFERSPQQRSSVADDVSNWIRANRF
jgi:hypothetical protein